VLFAAAVELVQVWVPGRHPRLSDFAAGVLGLGLGIGLAFISTRIARGRMARGEEWRASVRLSAVDDLQRQDSGLKKSWIRW
jgi:hypothetical protein